MTRNERPDRHECREAAHPGRADLRDGLSLRPAAAARLVEPEFVRGRVKQHHLERTAVRLEAWVHERVAPGLQLGVQRGDVGGFDEYRGARRPVSVVGGQVQYQRPPRHLEKHRTITIAALLPVKSASQVVHVEASGRSDVEHPQDRDAAMKSWVHVRSESDATIAYMGVQRASYMVVAASCLVPLAAVVSCSSSSASVAVACGGQCKPPYRLEVFFRPGVTDADARRVVDHCASGSTIYLRQQVTTRADRVRITVFTSEMAFSGAPRELQDCLRSSPKVVGAGWPG